MMKYILLCATMPLCAGSYTAWQADAAYRAEDYARARQLYEDAVAKNPEDMQSLYNSGKAAYKQKEYEAAAASFKMAAHAEQSSSALKEHSFFNLGDTELLQKNYQKALDAYENVLTIAPDNAHAKERIERVKKLMEEQQEQQKQDQEDQNQQQQNDQEQQDNQKDQQQDQGDQSNADNNQQPKDQSDKGDNQQDDTKKDQQGHNQQGGNGENKEDKKEQEGGSADSSEHQQQQDNDRQGNSKHSDQPSKNMNQQDQRGQEEPKEGKNQSQNPNDAKQGDRSQGQDKTSVDNASNTEKGHKGGSQDKENHEIPQRSTMVASLPENKLNEQEKGYLEDIEGEDKKVFKAFFGRTEGDHQQPGQKNW